MEKSKSTDDYKKRIELVEDALKQGRSKAEIRENLKNAGIIDNRGKLKKPYKNVDFSMGR